MTVLFLCSIAAAQIALCPCGIRCGDSFVAPQPKDDPEPLAAAGSCCPSGGQDDAPAPPPLDPVAPCGGEDGRCACEAEPLAETFDYPGAIVSLARIATPQDPDLAATPAALPVEAIALPASVSPRALPVRGSPPTASPRYLLHSVFII